MNKRQAGFGTVEIILIVLLVGLLGLIGFRFFTADQSKDNNPVATNEKTKDTSNTNKDDGKLDTSGWNTYSNEKRKFSLKYPKDWSVTDEQEVGTYNPQTNEIEGKDNLDLLIVSKGAQHSGTHDGAVVKDGGSMTLHAIYMPSVNSVKETFNFPEAVHLTIDGHEAYRANNETRSYFVLNKPYRFNTDFYYDKDADVEALKKTYDAIVQSLSFN